MGELETVEGMIGAAIGQEGADRSELLNELSSLSEKESGSALEAAASRHGAAAVPVLEEVAMSGGGGVALAAVEALGRVREPSAAAALRRIAAQSAHGKVAKSARRALHRLSSLGIAPPPVEGQRIERRRTRSTLDRALISFVDGYGNRLIHLFLEPEGDSTMLPLLLNETNGMVDARAYEMDRAAFDKESDRLLHDKEFPWAEMPPDAARQLLQEAHARNAANRTPLPLDYLAWRERIGSPEESYQQPLVYGVISAAEIRWDPRFLDSSGSSFELPPFRTWMIEKEELDEFIRERLLAQRSGLVLAGMDEESRDQLVIDNAVQQLFDPARRSILKRRLEEDAYVLWKVGMTLQAKQAVAAALALSRPTGRWWIIHLCAPWWSGALRPSQRGPRKSTRER